MERMEFLVQGSALDPYRVTLERVDNSLKAYCTCAAGSNGQMCKHRMRILQGNSDGLLGLDVCQLEMAVKWLIGTDAELAIRELADAESAYERSKKNLALAKKRLGRVLTI